MKEFKRVILTSLLKFICNFLGDCVTCNEPFTSINEKKHNHLNDNFFLFVWLREHINRSVKVWKQCKELFRNTVNIISLF